MNLGEIIANVFSEIGKGFRFSNKQPMSFDVKIKSDKESLKNDWEKIGKSLDSIMNGGDDK